jgi:hypothetical protein
MACGLCCKGVWFNSVSLSPEEVPRARTIGLKVIQKSGKSFFMQPCPKHVNGNCSAYGDWRPAICTNYTCSLLDQVLAGKISIEQAMRYVTAASEMAHRIKAETGPIEGGLLSSEFMSRLVASREPQNPNQLSDDSRMDAVALRVFFETYFEKSADKQSDSGDPIN